MLTDHWPLVAWLNSSVNGSLLTANAGVDRSRSLRIIPAPAPTRPECKHSSDSDVQTLPGHQHQGCDIRHPLINLEWAESRWIEDLLCWTGNCIQHQNLSYICSFHCCFDIPWNLKDPLFNYADQDTGQGSLCGQKDLRLYHLRVIFHLKIQSFDSKFKHLSLPTLEHFSRINIYKNKYCNQTFKNAKSLGPCQMQRTFFSFSWIFKRFVVSIATTSLKKLWNFCSWTKV